jgi:hypothetical protein
MRFARNLPFPWHLHHQARSAGGGNNITESSLHGCVTMPSSRYLLIVYTPRTQPRIGGSSTACKLHAPLESQPCVAQWVGPICPHPPPHSLPLLLHCIELAVLIETSAQMQTLPLRHQHGQSRQTLPCQTVQHRMRLVHGLLQLARTSLGFVRVLT